MQPIGWVEIMMEWFGKGKANKRNQQMSMRKPLNEHQYLKYKDTDVTKNTEF